MATPVWLNLTAIATEQSVTQTIYGAKLIRNDAAVGGGNLYIAFNASKASGASYIMLQPQEEWGPDEDIRASVIYYSSSTGSVPFRFYSKIN